MLFTEIITSLSSLQSDSFHLLNKKLNKQILRIFFIFRPFLDTVKNNHFFFLNNQTNINAVSKFHLLRLKIKDLVYFEANIYFSHHSVKALVSFRNKELVHGKNWDRSVTPRRGAPTPIVRNTPNSAIFKRCSATNKY